MTIFWVELLLVAAIKNKIFDEQKEKSIHTSMVSIDNIQKKDYYLKDRILIINFQPNNLCKE